MMKSKMLLTTMINDHGDMMTVIMMMTMTVMMIAIPCLLGWSAWGSLLGLVRRKWVTCATHCISIHCISLQHFYALFFCCIYMQCTTQYFSAMYLALFLCTAIHCISMHCILLYFNALQPTVYDTLCFAVFLYTAAHYISIWLCALIHSISILCTVFIYNTGNNLRCIVSLCSASVCIERQLHTALRPGKARA